MVHALERYRESLPPYRVLFDRYEFPDIAFKVVGIGSVGTFCEVVLFVTGGGDSLFLQVNRHWSNTRAQVHSLLMASAWSLASA